MERKKDGKEALSRIPNSADQIPEIHNSNSFSSFSCLLMPPTLSCHPSTSEIIPQHACIQHFIVHLLH